MVKRLDSKADTTKFKDKIQNKKFQNMCNCWFDNGVHTRFIFGINMLH